MPSKGRTLATAGGLENVEFQGDYIKIPSKNQSEIDSLTPQAGQLIYNSSIGKIVQSDGVTYVSIDSPPLVASVDVTNVNESADPQTFVITGSNFGTNSVGVLIDSNGQTLSPTTSARNSASQITISFTSDDILDGAVAEPISVKVINGSGLTSTLSDVIYVNASPAWVTNANLGEAIVNEPISTITLSATDPEGGNVTYSITNNSLPTGLSLSGADITGTADGTGYSAGTTTETQFFDITASDAQSNTKAKTFSITRKWLDGSTAALAAEDFDSILSFYPNAPTDNYTDSLWFKGVNGGTPYQMFTASHGGGKWMRFARVNRANVDFSSGAYSPFEIASPNGDTLTTTSTMVVPISAFKNTTYGQDIEVMCTMSGGSRGLSQGQLGAIQRGVDMVGQLSGRTYANQNTYGYSNAGNVSSNISSTNVGGATWQYSVDGTTWLNATGLANSLYATLGPSIANTSWDWTLAGNMVGGAGGALDYNENSQYSGWLIHDADGASGGAIYGYLAGVGSLSNDKDWAFAELWFRRNKNWS